MKGTLKYTIAASAFLIAGCSSLPPTQEEPTTTAQKDEAKCAQFEELQGYLEENFKETPVATGLTNSGELMTITANSRGDYTVLISRPDGCTMPVSSGVQLSIKLGMEVSS